MDKYKINFIYNDKIDINDIFIKALKKALMKYVKEDLKDNKAKKELSLLNKGEDI